MTACPLQIRQLHKRFVRDAAWVVEDVSFDLAEGELLTLVGPSGCGKTTILRLIAGFERIDAGEIRFGEDLLAAAPQQPVHIPPHRRNIGVVFQDYALFPHLSVLSNVMFGMRGRRRSRRDRALDLLAMLGLRDLARRQPHTLSGDSSSGSPWREHWPPLLASSCWMSRSAISMPHSGKQPDATFASSWPIRESPQSWSRMTARKRSRWDGGSR